MYGYQTTNRAKHNLKVHLILVCKYRKKLLQHGLEVDIKNIIRYIESNSDFEINQNCLRKHFWKEKTFWTDGYFVCSVGEASPQTIRNYIINQG